MYLAKTKKPSLGRVAVSAFHNNSDCKVSNMECDPHRLTPFRRCDQPPAVRAAPCYYRIISSDKLQHLFHPTRGERSNAAPARCLPLCHRHTRLTVVRRGCEWYRIVGVHGEAMYTAPSLRSACSHSSYNLPILGVEGPSPRVLLGVQGGHSLT